MQFLKLIAPILMLSALFSVSTASAHGDEASWEVPAGRYTADVGYDAEQFVAGAATRFDFSLKTAPGEAGVVAPFAEVWVRVHDTDLTYLATGIRKQGIGPTTLLYAFPKPGNYSLEVSFRDGNGGEVAAASFPVAVSQGEISHTATWSLYLGWVALGVVLGVLVSSLFSRRK